MQNVEAAQSKGPLKLHATDHTPAEPGLGVDIVLIGVVCMLPTCSSPLRVS